jgi:hypothetical protein
MEVRNPDSESLGAIAATTRDAKVGDLYEESTSTTFWVFASIEIFANVVFHKWQKLRQWRSQERSIWLIMSLDMGGRGSWSREKKYRQRKTRAV